ncbi:MAG: hypothetical protein ACI391_05355 [Muribaculaceae bacterium]
MKRHRGLVSLLVVMTLVFGMAFQHHHHCSDGSVCLCLNPAHHSGHHHGCGDGDDHCEQTLSDLLTKVDRHYHSPAPDVQVVAVLIEDEPLYRRCATRLVLQPPRHQRLPGAPIRAVRSLRAPPEV